MEMTDVPRFVGIAGPSCGGKTFLAEKLEEAFGEDRTLIIALDDYYRDLSHLALDVRARQNFDVPEAVDNLLLLEHLRLLRSNRPIEKPLYNFATHVRRKETVDVEPKSFVIVEGLFALYWASVRQLFDVGLFVVASHEECLRRRLIRDTGERGRSKESVLHQYSRSVAPMFERHVSPTQRHADLVVNGEAPMEEALERIRAHMKERLG